MNNMKKYVVMSGSWYYPRAYLEDVVGSYDDLEEAQDKERVVNRYDDGSWGLNDWACIIDRDTWKVLYKWENPDNLHGKGREEAYVVEWEKK